MALWLENDPNMSPSVVRQLVRELATQGVIGGIDGTSPDRLLYSVDLRVYMLGPGTVVRGETYTWSAEARSGSGQYGFVWERRPVNGSWVTVATGSSYSHTIGPSDVDSELRITVTSEGFSANRVRSIDIEDETPCIGEICPESDRSFSTET